MAGDRIRPFVRPYVNKIASLLISHRHPPSIIPYPPIPLCKSLLVFFFFAAGWMNRQTDVVLLPSTDLSTCSLERSSLYHEPLLLACRDYVSGGKRLPVEQPPTPFSHIAPIETDAKPPEKPKTNIPLLLRILVTFVFFFCVFPCDHNPIPSFLES